MTLASKHLHAIYPLCQTKRIRLSVHYYILGIFFLPRILSYILFCLFLLLPHAAADTISVSLPACDASIISKADGEHLLASGYSFSSSPGDPDLPYKQVYIILPPTVDPSSVSVNLHNSSISTLQNAYDIAPSPPLNASLNGKVFTDCGHGKRIISGRNQLVYNRNAFFPSSHIQLLEVGNIRKWRIAVVRYYPYRFNPLSHQLLFSSGGKISISYKTKAGLSPCSKSSDSLFADKVMNLASNFSEARSWYADSPISIFKDTGNSNNAGYVIITTSSIVSGSTKLQAFISQKQTWGFNVEVATEAQWGGGIGDTASNNIRSYLQANYISRNIKYVLFIGNPDPNSGDVPMKMLWPRYNEDSYREAPSDYFYADLTGNWDLNGNGYFGEESGDFGTGGIDLLPDVIVGRIPFYGSFSDLDSILQKCINYETGIICGSWIHNTLLSIKPSDSTTPGYQLGESIKTASCSPVNFTTTRVYESNYNLDPAPDFIPCSYNNVLSAWQEHAGFHFWWTHGSSTIASDVFSSDLCEYLDDNYPSFVFQCSCLNAMPEDKDNLAFSLLKRGAIATDAATRVSWYYPGQTVFSNSDSNAGMAYSYSIPLIRDHMPCGDAHFEMMLDIPNTVWANHCAFNLYGDPSLSYPWSPQISTTPLNPTDITSVPYIIDATVSSCGPLAQGSPEIKWNTDHSSLFNTVEMSLVSGNTYRGTIPPQPYGTTVYYYIYAIDLAGRYSTCPIDAPSSLFSFDIRTDTQAPIIQHTPLTDTGDKFGPYKISATVTDDLGVSSVFLYYRINDGIEQQAQMEPVGSDQYVADIPGPLSMGDKISYYIIADDISLNSNSSRSPSDSSLYSFRIISKIYVAVYNSKASPTYFDGGNSNAYSQVACLLQSDPDNRFQVSIITSFTTDSDQSSLSGQDALVLPDNAVPLTDLKAVENWFSTGKVILTMESAACYAAYTGWMWSASAGTNGFGIYWDYSSGYNDQIISTADPITSGYTVGQIIDSGLYEAQFITSKLPSDAIVLANSNKDSARCYAVYRDVPDRGRLVMLGPYIPPTANQYSLIREALVPPRQIGITSPNGGESYTSGDKVEITYTTSGSWSDDDKVRLEYTDGSDPNWYTIDGAESLPYFTGSFLWDTSKLLGSHNYKVRVSIIGYNLTDESDQSFSIIPIMSIDAAKNCVDGTLLKLSEKVVICDLSDYCYVEEPDRHAGIRISSAQEQSISDLVDVTGVMNTIDGERVLNSELIGTLGTGVKINPWAFKLNSLGGSVFGLQQAVMEYAKIVDSQGFTKNIQATVGLNNIGLLVRVFGRVTSVGSDYFYVDDGSECDDGSGAIGVRVLYSGAAPPTQGQYVMLNAVSSTYFDRGNLFRALVLPNKDYIQVCRD